MAGSPKARLNVSVHYLDRLHLTPGPVAMLAHRIRDHQRDLQTLCFAPQEALERRILKAINVVLARRHFRFRIVTLSPIKGVKHRVLLTWATTDPWNLQPALEIDIYPKSRRASSIDDDEDIDADA